MRILKHNHALPLALQNNQIQYKSLFRGRKTLAYLKKKSALCTLTKMPMFCNARNYSITHTDVRASNNNYITMCNPRFLLSQSAHYIMNWLQYSHVNGNEALKGSCISQLNHVVQRDLFSCACVRVESISITGLSRDWNQTNTHQYTDTFFFSFLMHLTARRCPSTCVQVLVSSAPTVLW